MTSTACKATPPGHGHTTTHDHMRCHSTITSHHQTPAGTASHHQPPAISPLTDDAVVLLLPAELREVMVPSSWGFDSEGGEGALGLFLASPEELPALPALDLLLLEFEASNILISLYCRVCNGLVNRHAKIRHAKIRHHHGCWAGGLF